MSLVEPYAYETELKRAEQLPKPVFAVLCDMPSQKPAIEKYCFGSCGKIIVGAIKIPMDDWVLTALPCREVQCPALDRQMEEPLGELPETGEPVFLRKLLEGP